MSDKATKINRWLRAFVFPADGDIVIAAVVARHVSVNEKTSDLQTFKVYSKEMTNETLADLVKNIDDIMEDDAEGIGGVQRYVLGALDGEKKQIGRLTLRYAGQGGENDDFGESSEPATAKGLTAQAMRHAEAFARIASAESGHVITMQQRMLSTMGAMVENMMTKQVEMIEMTEELLSMRHQRDLDMEEQKSKHEIRTALLEKATVLVPAIIKRLTGVSADGELSPELLEARNVCRIIVKDEARMEKLMETLAPEEMIALMEFAKDDAEKTETALVNGKPS